MATAVDDEVDQAAAAPITPSTPAKPTDQPVVEVEIGKDSGNDRGWAEVGEVVIPGRPTGENQTDDQPPTSGQGATQPTISKPRSPRHRQSGGNFPSPEKAKSASGDSFRPSPAIAPESMLSQPATGQPGSVPIAESPAPSRPSVPPDASLPASSVEVPIADTKVAQPGTADRSVATGSENAAPSETSAAPEPPEAPASEPPADASPAFVGEEQLVHGEEAENLAERGQGEQPRQSGKELGKEGKDGGEKKEAGQGDEKKDDDKPLAEGEVKEPAKDDTGALKGVAGAGEEKYDPFSAAKTPTAGTAPTAAPGSKTGEPGTGAPTDEEKKVSAPEGATKPPEYEEDTVVGRARALREGKVVKQKEDQQQSIARAAELVKGRQFNAAAVVAQAQELSERVYKQAWQYAQEVAEDGALSIAGFIVFAPLALGLYILRWMFGNMMGELFTKEVKVPSIPGAPSDGETVIKLRIFPPYAIADLQDYERHLKFFIIACITGVLVGFIIMLLYYYTHWWELIWDAVKYGWAAIINLFPAYTPS